MASQWPPRPSQKPSQIHSKSQKKRPPKMQEFSKQFLNEFSEISTWKSIDFLMIFWCFFHRTRKTLFCKNRALASTGARFLRFRTCKKHANFNKKGLKMRVPKKHRKNHSRNRFSEPFWPPKPLQNRRKIQQKSKAPFKSKKKRFFAKNDPT